MHELYRNIRNCPITFVDCLYVTNKGESFVHNNDGIAIVRASLLIRTEVVTGVQKDTCIAHVHVRLDSESMKKL